MAIAIGLPAETSLRRDVRVMGVVGAAHFVSHFFQLTLPPLFPFLREEFGMSYAALGVVMSGFYAVSGVGQTAAGFLVDRVGAPRVLIGGIVLLGGAISLVSLTTSTLTLALVALLAGLGNAVFHPADYSIFNTVVDRSRLGRAYSVHGLMGNLGWAAAPGVAVGLAGLFHWRIAVLVMGLGGVVFALGLLTQSECLQDRRRPTARAREAPRDLLGDVRLLLSAPILIAFAYFALLASALIGFQTFSVTALMSLYGAPLGLATGALTGFLLGSASGILAGGLLADRTARHDVVAGIGMLLAAAVTFLVAGGLPTLVLLPPMLAFAGFCLGATSPSRDMLVRGATPPGASGKVYGFVYSGLDLGSALAPLGLGWLLDRGATRTMLVVVGGLMLVTIATVVEVRRRGTAGRP